MNEFPNKWWTESSINRLLKKSRDFGTANRLAGIGRPRRVALKKTLACLTIWFLVEKIYCELREWLMNSGVRKAYG